MSHYALTHNISKKGRGVLGHFSKVYSGQPTNKTELLFTTDNSATDNKDKLLINRRHKIKITKLTKYHITFFTLSLKHIYLQSNDISYGPMLKQCLARGFPS